MRFSRLALLSLLSLLVAVPFAAAAPAVQAQATGPAELKQAMVRVLEGIEAATGREPRASQGIAALSDDVFADLYGEMDAEPFIFAARRITDRMDVARSAWARGEFEPATADDLTAAWAAASSPYSPAYPDATPYYAYLRLLGIIDSADDRCEAEWLTYYGAFVFGAQETLNYFERMCAMATCDPVGFVCAAFCIPVETAKIALMAAREPLDLCDNHAKGVDSAEIEAGYENTKRILADLAAQESAVDAFTAALAAHDANIDGDLAAHDARLHAQLATHDTDIKALIARLLANQAEIIKLLKTPEGRRPGWNREGY
jgi:hypothetical protein